MKQNVQRIPQTPWILSSSSTAVPSGVGECGSLRELAASCRDIEAGVYTGSPAQDGALSSLVQDNRRQTTEQVYVPSRRLARTLQRTGRLVWTTQVCRLQLVQKSDRTDRVGSPAAP